MRISKKMTPFQQKMCEYCIGVSEGKNCKRILGTANQSHPGGCFEMKGH